MRETQAIAPSATFERVLLVSLLMGSVWCGVRVFEMRTRGEMPLQRASVTTQRIGSEWNEARVYESLSSPEAFARFQAALTDRVALQLGRKHLELEHVVGKHTLWLYPLRDFYDYGVETLYPPAGAVVKLTEGPKCVQFRWSRIPVHGVQYTVELAKKRDFVFYRSFGASTNTVGVEVSRGSDFFWRVRVNYGREVLVSNVSSFLSVEPELSEEQKRTRTLATRMRDSSAWLNDLRFCPRPR